MPVQDDVLLDRLPSSGIACNHRPSSTPFPFVPTQSPASTGAGTGTIAYSTLTSINYIEATLRSMNDQTTFSSTTFGHKSSMTGNQEVTDQLKIETSPTSSYYAPSSYYSPSTTSLYPPSSYRESSYTPFSTVSDSVPEVIFLHADQQQPYFSHESTTATATTVRDNQEGYLKHEAPPLQPLSMLSSVASLLPNHQRQHVNQGSDSIVVPTMIQTPRFRTQQPIHPPQSVCLSQSWDISTPTHRFAFTPTPAPITPSTSPHTPLQSSTFISVPIPLQFPFTWSAETINDRDSTPDTNVDQYLPSDNDKVKQEKAEHDEKIFLHAIEAAQERISLSPSRKRIRGPNAGVRRSAAELDKEEFTDRGLAQILVYADDNLRELVAQQNIAIREPHVYDANMMDLYCLSRGDGVHGRHFHTGDNCLKNQMGCRVALAVRYAYQSDLTETHLLWVDQIDRQDIPIAIIMSFPACGNLIMRALKDDPNMDAQYRILRTQGYSDPPRASSREYGKIASLNRVSWSIAFQNHSHITSQAMGFLQRVSQAYQGAMGNPSRGMLKKRKMRAVVRDL